MTAAGTLLKAIGSADLATRRGRVRRILPTHFEADGPSVPLGAICHVDTVAQAASPSLLAEVVGVDRDFITLAPLEDGLATYAGARVEASADIDRAPVGDGFLGRVVDPLARPLDGWPAIRASDSVALHGRATPPLSRQTGGQILETGVRAIDGMLTLGHGQRVGIFAASGVGKTSLLNQLIRQVDADCCVICLVGERGREVEALWSSLSPTAKARTVVVAATSDQVAALRARAGPYALALAEHWRDAGRKVLLVIDSVTRLAMALRETGLAAGEPPTVRAYPPSVFSAIPRLVERCGAVKAGGAITAIMTVLSETDDVDDPISELMKSLLDGHILLSRELAERGHFPAIDVPRSVSRLASALTSVEHRAVARRTAELLSVYESSRALIETGVYSAGANADIDRAVAARRRLAEILQQDQNERTSLDDTLERLKQAVEA